MQRCKTAASDRGTERKDTHSYPIWLPIAAGWWEWEDLRRREVLSPASARQKAQGRSREAYRSSRSHRSGILVNWRLAHLNRSLRAMWNVQAGAHTVHLWLSWSGVPDWFSMASLLHQEITHASIAFCSSQILSHFSSGTMTKSPQKPIYGVGF
jgi:hypothetical protein